MRHSTLQKLTFALLAFMLCSALPVCHFSDAPGKGLPFDRAPGLIKYFNEWFDFYSGGKMKLKWFEVNKWLRVDALSTDFNQKTNPFTAVNLMNTKVFGARNHVTLSTASLLA